MPKGQVIVHQNLDSTLPAVSAALTKACAALEDFGLATDDLSTAQIVLAEVLNNVVEHAYQYQPGHQIELWIEMSGRSLLCRVMDSGRPLPDGCLSKGSSVNLDVEISDLPEGGFGWFLIKSLAKDISYRLENGKNTLRFQLAAGLNPTLSPASEVTDIAQGIDPSE